MLLLVMTDMPKAVAASQRTEVLDLPFRWLCRSVNSGLNALNNQLQ
jgi:hypothetical protein